MEMIFAKPRMAVVDLITCTDRSKPQGKHVEMCRHTEVWAGRVGTLRALFRRERGEPLPLLSRRFKKGTRSGRLVYRLETDVAKRHKRRGGIEHPPRVRAPKETKIRKRRGYF